MEVTVRQALDAAVARLRARSSAPASIRSAKLDAELLLMHILHCDLAALLTHPERPLAAAQSLEYEAVLQRRLAAEPVQYITGEQEFFGLAMKVTPEVFIPRPETEHLVEALLERVQPEAALRIVDVGTGSGAIAVALAHALPQSEVTAMDLSPAALGVARQNAERHGVAGRIRFLESDLLAGLDLENLEGSFDAVVSNPPYIAEGEDLEPQVRNYEPRPALYAGASGLEIYERLAPQARAALRPGGWLILEIGCGQQPALRRLLRKWASLSFVEDLQGIPRVAVARR